MSRTALNKILDRSLLDMEFRNAIRTDPDSVLGDYDLTAEERTAVEMQDFKELEQVGLVLTVTARFVISDPPMIAMYPPANAAGREAELQQAGSEIVAMQGERTEAIKELLLKMR